MECKHRETNDKHVVVVSGVINRWMTVCEDCGKVVGSKDYVVKDEG